MSELHLADDMTLPVDAVTQVLAILAKRGAGKTHTSAVLVEEMVAVGAQVVILDPVGVWWGLRTNTTGDAPGLPFAVFGGSHGDLPLDPTMGAAAADLAVDEHVLLVFDLSSFDSKADQNRFVTDFTGRLYHRNRQPLHLVLEEADEFAPERGLPGERQMLGSVQRLVRRGRSRGIGVTLISQRSAAVSKGVLTQADVLIMLRTTAPHDQRAIGEWIQAKGVSEQRESVLTGLSKLPTGTAWVWAPEMDILHKVHIRGRRTFDSSATPKLGQTLITPTAFADIDISALRTRFAAPAGGDVAGSATMQLQQQVADLSNQLRAARAEISRLKAAPARVEIHEVRVVDEAAVKAVEDARRQLTSTAAALTAAITTLQAGTPAPASAPPAPTTRRAGATPDPADAAPPPPPMLVAGDGKLPKAQRLVLAALAPYYPQPRTKTQIALLAGYASNGGGFNNAISALRSAGFITGSGAAITVTPAGLDALGPFAPLPTGEALRQHWLGQLGRAPRLILTALCQAWPATLNKTDIGVATSYQPDGGGFNNAISRLRTLELITGPGTALRASDDLFT